MDPDGLRRTKKDPTRLSKLRQNSQAAFAASSFSSWFVIKKTAQQWRVLAGPTLTKDDFHGRYLLFTVT